MKRLIAALVLTAIFGWIAVSVVGDLIHIYQQQGVTHVALVVLAIAGLVALWQWAERALR